MCCEISGKESLITPEIPVVLLGEKGLAHMREYALCPYDFWEILCTACSYMPDKSVAEAVWRVINEISDCCVQRSGSCGRLPSKNISDLSQDETIQLTAIGAIRWNWSLDSGKGGAVYSPLYTRVLAVNDRLKVA